VWRVNNDVSAKEFAWVFKNDECVVENVINLPEQQYSQTL